MTSHPISQHIVCSFAGQTPTPAILSAIQQGQISGVTLYRHFNMGNPQQIRALTTSLQQAASDSNQPFLLIAADQEGGTLIAVPETTAFPGNMALGATRSPDLARRMGHAVGLELLAMGINTNYAPVCDVNVNPLNPVIGVRSFSEDPDLVATLGAAVIEGLQSAGVAATAKHFPGHGDTAQDSHLAAPVVPHDLARLNKVELPPFAAAVRAGVKLIMTAHIALPALTNGEPIPATLSHSILNGLLRGQLEFEGPIISDAMDMAGVRQGLTMSEASVKSLVAGVDLLLFGPADQHATQTVYTAISDALASNTIPAPEAERSAERIASLKQWMQQQTQPPLDVVGCPEHQSLALEIAAAATTLVRFDPDLLPLAPTLHADARIAAVIPIPANLTPADTSSYITPDLATSLRRYHSAVDEFRIPIDPSPEEVSALIEKLRAYSLVIIGTINAVTHPGQSALVTALVNLNTPIIAVAMRLPYDILSYPTVQNYV
ncbi:MAG: glycoside hydrolase family 3 protein, partial [Chloroflexia bacterium]